MTTVWTFLSNHTHVLLCLAMDGDARIRDVADRVGLTERAVQRIITELEEAGTIERQRIGRRNHYVIHREIPFRHPLESTHSVGELLEVLLKNRADA